MNLQTNLAFLFSSSTLFSHINLLQSIYYVVGLKFFFFYFGLVVCICSLTKRAFTDMFGLSGWARVLCILLILLGFSL